MFFLKILVILCRWPVRKIEISPFLWGKIVTPQKMGVFLMKKVNNVKSAYFTHTHFIHIPGYQRELVQNSANSTRLLILI